MKIYSTRQAGAIFGVTAQTIKSWIRKNNIPCARTSHQEHILTDETLEALKATIYKRYKLDGIIDLDAKLAAITPSMAMTPDFEIDDDIWEELAEETDK